MRANRPLETMSHKKLAEQHATLVRELMLLWGEHFPMVEWVEPISAVRMLREKLRRAADLP